MRSVASVCLYVPVLFELQLLNALITSFLTNRCIFTLSRSRASIKVMREGQGLVSQAKYTLAGGLPSTERQPSSNVAVWNKTIFVEPLSETGASNPHYGWEINPYIWHGKVQFTLFGPNTEVWSYSLALHGLDTLMRLSEWCFTVGYTELHVCAVYINIQ